MAINSPVGSTSVNARPLRAVAFGFVSVNVSVLVLPVPSDVGEKLLDMVGTMGRGQPDMMISSI